MAIRKLCVEEITTIGLNWTETLTCTNPAHTPVGPGDECNAHIYGVTVDLSTVPPTLSFTCDAQFEYQYLQDGATFQDYCNILSSQCSTQLPAGVHVCCGQTLPSVTYSVACSPGSITTTPTYVAGQLSYAFTIDNLCSYTIICVDDTICP
ncbi:hypothetical protein EDD75_0719 [Thermodesulfitimonas autotrophica]|uniref:Uncharacterized protein n=1 Tax=Thermodesulfitimonas autotrophica TaxID=1894989 RepID=A0A3N5AY89_9THEO|nr:hypothetical protein [Thermodesulfitimonas autotrophica]RPF49893.1 hypothetical protein EDD75_0719 [Thermodesulfitimonas autotrophica]